MLLSLPTLFATLSSVFRSRAVLQLEHLALRHQIGVLQRSARKRIRLTPGTASSGPGYPGSGAAGARRWPSSSRKRSLLGIAPAFACSGPGALSWRITPSSWSRSTSSWYPPLVSRFSRCFLVLAHDRRRIVRCKVTAHHTAEWTGQQVREAFPFAQPPR